MFVIVIATIHMISMFARIQTGKKAVNQELFCPATHHHPHMYATCMQYLCHADPQLMNSRSC